MTLRRRSLFEEVSENDKQLLKLSRVLGGRYILFVLTAKAISLEDSAFFLDYPLDYESSDYFPFLQRCISFATFPHVPYHFL